MTRIAAIFLAFAVSACGVDGEPTTPTKSGVSITGTAMIGISK